MTIINILNSRINTTVILIYAFRKKTLHIHATPYFKQHIVFVSSNIIK